MRRASAWLVVMAVLLFFAGLTPAMAGTVKYRYDEAGRLIDAQYGNTATIRYEYDPMGNLLKRSVVLGSSMLYIPFYQAGPSTFLGIAVTNASSSPANLQFRAFGPQGTMLPFPDNPCVEILQPQEQMAKLASEIFKVDGSTPQAGWIELSSDNSQVGAFFESANNALTQMDGSVGVTVPARKFYFTRVHEGQTGFRGQGAGTYLSLANPNDSPITAQLRLYALASSGGTAVNQVGATLTQVIPAKGVLYRLISDLFGALAVPGGYVEVAITEDKGAVGFELIQLSGQTTLFGLNANYGNQTSELFSAQLASASSLFTSVKLINSSTESRTLTLSYATGVVQTQADAYGDVTTLTPNLFDLAANTETQFTVTYADGTSDVYQHTHTRRVMKGLTDATGKAAVFQSDPSRDQVTSVTDRLGDSTSFARHPETGTLLSVTNAKGDILSYIYAPRDQTFTNPLNNEEVTFTWHDLTGINYPDGTSALFTRDVKGNVLTHRDREGKTWTYTYNQRGQVLTATNPAGGVVTNTYNADATLASSTDSDTGKTTYSYDTYKRLNKITRPDGASIQFTYDLNDWLTSIRDENSHTYTYNYDANGNLARVTDPKGGVTAYAYDLMDRLVEASDRLGKKTLVTYDNMGRVASITDPNNLAANYGYDPRRWQNRLSLGGRTCETAYDDEGIVASRSTPSGGTTAFESDKLGHVTGIRDPLSQTTTLVRDSMSRVTGVTDALNRTMTYSYDGRGLLSGVSTHGIGTATYLRNDLGLLSKITDLNGQGWMFGHTSSGRLASLQDPLTNETGFSYDGRGRLSQVAHADGSTAALTYDATGNVTRRQHSGGPDLRFTYDELDRLLSANDIAFTRDAEGRIISTDNTGTVFGASYDDGGRLKTVTYNNGLFTVTYTYDSVTGLLSRVGDSLTGARGDFSYDVDRKLTTITRTMIRYYYNYGLGLNPIVAEKNDSAGRFLRYYVWTPGGSLLYMVDAADSNKVRFYHFDRAGSVLALTDSARMVTDSYAYTPCGNLLGHTGESEQPFTFVGRWGVRQEGSEGLYHMRARYCDADTARFISRDPIWPQTLLAPEEINPYLYAKNNPVSILDPEGTKGLLGELIEQALGIDIPIPAGPWDVVFKLFEGTPTGDWVNGKPAWLDSSTTEENRIRIQQQMIDYACEERLKEEAERWKDPDFAQEQYRLFIENFRDDPEKADLLRKAEQELRRMNPPPVAGPALTIPSAHVGNRETPGKPGRQPDPVRPFQNHEHVANSLLASFFDLALISLERDIQRAFRGHFAGY